MPRFQRVKNQWSKGREKASRFSFKDLSKKEKIALTGLLALLILLPILAFSLLRETPTELSKDKLTRLAQTDFSTSVSVTGTIAPEKEINVYTTQAAPVKELFVEEGDVVEEGQVLAVLDDKALRQQIKSREASLGVSAKNTAASVASARHRYNAAVRALRDGTNASLIAARGSVTAARNQWEAAEKTWSDYKRSIEAGYAPDLAGEDASKLSGSQAVKNAEQALKTAQRNLDDAKSKFRKAKSDKNNYDQERDRLRRERDDLQAEANEQGRNSNAAEYAAAQSALWEARAAANQAAADLAAARAENPQNPSKIAELESRKAAKDSALASAQARFNTIQSSYDDETSRINSTAKDLAQVNADLADAESRYSRADGDITNYDVQIPGLEDAVAQAKLNLEAARDNEAQGKKNRKGAKQSRADTLGTYRATADAAKDALAQAEASLTSAENAALDELQSFEDSVNSAEAAGDLSASQVELANLYEDLKDYTIRATANGTVSKIFAKKGNAPAGPLFTIENKNSLLIKADLKAFDLQSVRVGMPVEIKSDATGNEVYRGRVVSIADTAKSLANIAAPADGQGAAGSGSTDPTFTAKVILEHPPKELLVGMKARLKIITNEDDDVYAVPFNAVIEDGKHKSILVAHPVNKNQKTYRLESLPVKTSLENDVSIVIEGKGLKDGLLLVSDPEGFSDGQTIIVVPESNNPMKPAKGTDDE